MRQAFFQWNLKASFSYYTNVLRILFYIISYKIMLTICYFHTLRSDVTWTQTLPYTSFIIEISHFFFKFRTRFHNPIIPIPHKVWQTWWSIYKLHKYGDLYIIRDVTWTQTLPYIHFVPNLHIIYASLDKHGVI